jgi:hypothetical protein
MRLIIVLCGFLFVGCYSEKQAQRELIEAQLKQPAVVAKFVAKNYPCDSVLMRIDTIEKVKWRIIVDSLNKKIIIKRDTLNKILKDTIFLRDNDCLNKISKLKNELEGANEFIDGLQEALNREVPVVYKTSYIKDTAYIQTKNFEIEGLKKDYEIVNAKRIDLLWWVIILLILLGLSIILHFVRK